MALTRLLVSVAAVALVALGLLALLPDCAYACTCAMSPRSQEEIARQALSDSTAVFSAEVVDFQMPPTTTAEDFRRKVWTIPGEGPATATLRVSEVWKGPERGTLEVSTPSSGAACGYSFEEGREYLVYAYGKEEPYKVNLCSQTRLLSKAGAHLQMLGDGQRPRREESLADTSGGVPVLGVAGLAALATTAAFLLLRRLL